MKKIDEGNIGDFANNKVLEWGPISFAIEFIYRMRKNKSRLQNIPSTRQAIAIPKLITAMYYRKCNLIPDDFITAAVITTPIEDQSIAQKIAFDIIFNEKKKGKGSKQGLNTSMQKGSSDGKAEFMDELLDVFDSQLDIGNLDTDELIDQAMEEFSGLTDFVNNIYDQAEENNEPYKSLVDIIEQRTNYKYILEQGIKDIERLKNDCHQTILRDINDLSPQDIIASTKLNWGKDLLDQSSVPWIHLTAQYTMNDADFQNSLADIMKNEEVGTSARSLNYLRETGMDKSKVNSLAQNLVNRVENMIDLHEISDVLNYIPNFDHQKVIDNSIIQDPGTTFNLSRSLDERFHSDLTNELFKNWAKKNPEPPLAELFQTQADLPEWRNILNHIIKKKINEYINTNGKASYNLSDLANKLMNLSYEAKFEPCRDAFVKNAKRAGLKALESAHDNDQFKNALKSMVKNNIPLDQGKTIQFGKKLGVSEEKILEIFGGNYKLLKTMYEQNIGNFKRYSRIMKKIKLSAAQMSELLGLALDNNNYEGLGALSHHHMGDAFKAAAKRAKNGLSGLDATTSSKRAQRRVAESLNAGSGDNLLIQWFYHRNKVPSHLKDFVKKLCKDALIKIALNIISNQRGSGEKGLIPTNQLRPFIIGDDIDLINIDATIENIIMQGKSIDMITTEDLLVRRTEKGRVSICFLLDISGSMSGMKLAACSIAVMVLIGALHAEEVAICFFESNTHIVKEFGDSRDLEDVADELLDLRARGGTQVQAALEWGAKELQKTSTERKICFLLTDCAFGESKSTLKKELDEYVNQRVQFILGVNTRSYSKKYSKLILETTQGEIVHITKFMEIPHILMEVLEKIG
jgi:Mg-chelatase subunit ChlD